jgi:hypothetical protein
MINVWPGNGFANFWGMCSIESSGNHTIRQRPAVNSTSAHYVVQVDIRRGASIPGLVTFKKIVLIGPENQNWRDAFKN